MNTYRETHTDARHRTSLFSLPSAQPSRFYGGDWLRQGSREAIPQKCHLQKASGLQPSLLKWPFWAAS